MIDWLLTAWLVIVFPAYSGWRSLRPRKAGNSKASAHLRTVVLGLTPLIVLAVDWMREHRSFADLGLGPPTQPAALMGLGFAALVVLGLCVACLFTKTSSANDPNAETMERMLPQTSEEWPAFVAFCLTVGVAWEVLYRGYLLWMLSPIVGTVGAVVVASVAYGLAHGVNNWKRAVGSLVAAALFTTGYVITQSLWWLMLIHTSLPLMAALLTLRARRLRGSDPSVMVR